MAASGTPLVIRLLAEQRKRCLATILTSAEASPWWSRLTPEQQALFRDQVRGAIAVFYDLTRDLIKVTDDEAPRNDIVLELIRSIHSQQQQITQRMERT